MNTTQTLYLALLGPITAVLALIGLRRLRPFTRALNLVRRMLRIEAFEQLTISELNSYRRDVDRWTRTTGSKIREVREDVTDLDEDVQRRNTALSADRTRNNRVRTEVEELGILLRSYTDALGPMWTTKQGHRMPMRLLSTTHLTNIIEGAFGPRKSREFAASELRRRSVDAGYRAAEAAATSDKSMAEGNDLSLPACYTLAMAERVQRVLPLWAQNIIAELLEGNNSVLTPSNTRRIKRLPIWTRELITDITRQA